VTAILIVRLGALGDVVHAMPVVAALRRQWPSARIDWLVDPRYVDVVQLVSGVSCAIAFDPRGLVAGAERAATLATIAALRREQYDVVFDLQGLVKSAAAARLAGGRQTIGFARAHLREPASRFFYTRTVDVPEGRHVIWKNLALLGSIGLEPAEPLFSLNLPASPLVDQVVGRFGEEAYVAVNPGAAWPNKRWPAERFGRVASRLRDAHLLRTLVVWGPGEQSLAASVVAASDGAAEMAPPTAIVELFGVFRGARLAIAGDTGPLHIAAAVGTPVVALFGPTDPARNGPWRAADVSVSRVDQCECRYERRCRRSVPCIDDISVDQVVNAVAARLAGASREAGA
jgi:lipopolysaccharide heptosyltransferase I